MTQLKAENSTHIEISLFVWQLQNNYLAINVT